VASKKIREVFGKTCNKSKDNKKRKHLQGAPQSVAAFLRLAQIVGDPRANPPIPALLAIGKSSWWAGIKTGRYPEGIKLGPRTTVWSLQAVLDSVEKHVAQGGKP
jgi:predicted DNA-binding transcriptional regulator AlpA